MSRKVRVRFAPSPTGPLHMGGVRTALFNYLFAKKFKGDFILRIEDTDQARFVEGAEEYIMNSLEWCGMKIDEGVREGGKYGPYKQSERKDIYKKHVLELIENGHAYYAFDTPEELDVMRKTLESQGSSNRQYNAETRMSMKNSYSLTAEEVKQKINTGVPYVVRFNTPVGENLTVHDIIRGEVTVNTSLLDDKVLFKSDGLPTYHLANIVDDKYMEISHVIRGEEWLPSLPLHVLLYRSFGWLDSMPEFAHLPLLLKPDGKGKLSKRDGDKMGFPVFPMQWKDPKNGEIYSGYKEDGYLRDAFVNMIALLGWSPGTTQEIFSMSDLVEQFDLKRVGKAGAKFSPEKAKWFNQQYLKEMPDKELVQVFRPILIDKSIDCSDEYLEKVSEFVKERIVLINDFWAHAAFFFEAPNEYNKAVIKKNWKDETPEILKNIIDILSKIDDNNFTVENTEELVKQYVTDNELGFGKVFNPLRLVLTGTGGGPHIFDIIFMLGKNETVKRIQAGIDSISK